MTSLFFVPYTVGVPSKSLMAQAAPAPVIARFQFKPDRVEEFTYGTEFVTMEFDKVEEVIELCEEFKDALLDVIVSYNKRVISLAEQERL